MTDTLANKTPMSAEEYCAMIGHPLGVSRWIEIDQQRIDQFAHVTQDHQFIHVDPVASARTAFGGTIAHGFLVLSLLAPMITEVAPVISGAVMGVNYGFDRIRFIAPVRSGQRIRGILTLNLVERRADGGLMSHIGVSVEIEGESKPALVADWLTLVQIARHEGTP